MGPRVLVTVDVAKSDIEERAAKAGIYIVQEERNTPKPTTGVVVAVGSDPELQENLKEGDTVIFAKYAGTDIVVQGETYRSLEFHEIISIIREEKEDE